MKIATIVFDDTPPEPVRCAHCEAPVSGACSLNIHVVDNPEHGRPEVNAFVVFQFCGAACRAAWWDVPAVERCFHDHNKITSHAGSKLSVLVIHNDRGARYPIPITTDDGALLTEHMGVVVDHHGFDDPAHIERWWRGEVEAESLHVPTAGEAHDA